jgi:hypothetical protein
MIMSRKFFLAAFALGLLMQPGAKAEQRAAANGQANAPAQKSPEDFYLLCTFYPKPGTCEDVYRYAMRDPSISAQAVKSEYTGYVRYLGKTNPLTEQDRQYLKDKAIRVPNDLSPANQSGLHNVINDPTLSEEVRPAAINGFLSRAVEAELYCGFNTCDTESA